MSTLRLFLFSLALILSLTANGDIREDVARTIVQVRSGGKSSTGFFWSDGRTVLTTLHSLGGNGVVQVRLTNGQWKNAQVKKVYKHGDLIMLDVPDYESPYFLNSFYTGTPSSGTSAFTIGFNGGLFNYISRDFKVGLSQGNTLQSLLPVTAANELRTLGFPSLDVRVVYLEGSLLHGFSGSPIVDMNGKLVGIADGGLENGAVDISWCIHASHIPQLLASNESLPSLNTNKLNTLFAAEQYESDEADNYINVGNAQFKLTKTRTFSQLNLTAQYTSTDGLGLQQLVNFFAPFNPASFRYDVYLDMNSGATVVVPEGETLREENGMIVYGDNKIKVFIDLRTTYNLQQQSLIFEQNFNYPGIIWTVDQAWTYAMPYYGPAGTVVRRKAFMGFYGNFQQLYFFEALAGKGNYFLGVAAQRNNALVTPMDTREWAMHAIAIQLSSFSN